MMITLSKLLDVVYRFYPRGVHNFARIHVPPNEPFYDDTEERRRLVEAANRGRAEYPTWKAMIRRLGDRYDLQDGSIKLLAGGVAPAYSARIYRPKDLEPVPPLRPRASLSFHVSLLGPYYGIHDRGGPDEIPAAIAAEIEATYPGYQQIPLELGNEIVPDMAMDGVLMGEATIYTLLFSDVWTWVDPPKSWAQHRESMKHTFAELLDIVYRYYPRGVGIVDGDIDMQAILDSEEQARLVAARREAGTDERWHAMRRRISERFPGMLWNRSLHLQAPTGGHDACYSFTIHLPGATDHRELWFQVSFLVPYYIIHGSCTTDIVKEPRTDFFWVIFQGAHLQVSGSPFDPKLISNVDDERLKHVTIKKHHVTFDLLPEERPYAEWIAREIETTFGCKPMPPEVGTVFVPDLAAPKLPGEIRLYDCLFSDHHEWVKPSPSDEPAPAVSVDASHLTEPFLAVITVLGALFHILRMLMAKASCAFCWSAKIDGTLHKEDVLMALANFCPFIESPVTPRGMAVKHEIEAATRELEALVAAWDGDGAPPDAMVAWASSLLASSVLNPPEP